MTRRPSKKKEDIIRFHTNALMRVLGYEDPIAMHRAELERLTGKMVGLRDRKAYQKIQRELHAKRRERERAEVAQARAIIAENEANKETV